MAFIVIYAIKVPSEHGKTLNSIMAFIANTVLTFQNLTVPQHLDSNYSFLNHFFCILFPTLFNAYQRSAMSIDNDK